MTDELIEVRGRCPVCSGTLDTSGSELVCSLEQDHFRIASIVFQEAWGIFERQLEEKGKLSDMREEASELLETLLRNNLALNKPTIKSVLGEQ